MTWGQSKNEVVGTRSHPALGFMFGDHKRLGSLPTIRLPMFGDLNMLHKYVWLSGTEGDLNQGGMGVDLNCLRFLKFLSTPFDFITQNFIYYHFYINWVGIDSHLFPHVGKCTIALMVGLLWTWHWSKDVYQSKCFYIANIVL